MRVFRQLNTATTLRVEMQWEERAVPLRVEDKDANERLIFALSSGSGFVQSPSSVFNTRAH